jgi:hypothetical protein
MTFPLAAVMYFTSTRHPLAAAGIAGLIVVHYLAGLVVETLMSVRIVSHMPAPGSAAGPKGIPLA